MKFLTFENAYKCIVIIAIAYLVYSVLGIANLSSKNIDKIEKSQELIMKSAEDIIKNHDKAAAVADSLDKVHIKQIEDLTTQLNVVQTQLKSVQSEIKSYKTAFDKNKVDLPNPWQN